MTALQFKLKKTTHPALSQTAGSLICGTYSSQGRDFSWQTQGVHTGGRFWGGGRWRWISEVIRDDILQRLQSASKSLAPKELLVSWEKVRKDPQRPQAVLPFSFFFGQNRRLTTCWHCTLSHWNFHSEKHEKYLNDDGLNGEKHGRCKNEWKHLKVDPCLSFSL